MIRERLQLPFIRASAMRIGYVVAGALIGMAAQGAQYPYQIWEPREPAWKLIGEDSEKSQVYVDLNPFEKNTNNTFVWAFVQVVYASHHKKLDHDHASPLVRAVYHIEFGCAGSDMQMTNRTAWYENGETSGSPMPLLFQIPRVPIAPKSVFANILKAVCVPSPADADKGPTNVRMDPDHPLKFGEDYYPEASRGAREEGRCVVTITVAADGRIAAETLQSSSGHPRLDEACLKGFHGGRMFPATKNGKPVETTVDIPVDWKL